MKRSNLQRKTPLKRKPWRPRTRKEQLPPEVRAAKRAWGRLARTLPCAVCGETRHVHGHHVTPLRVLKAHGVDPALWYDPRNLLPLCSEPAPNRCHDRHELHVRLVPRDRLTAANLEFALEVGLVWLLHRTYPENDERKTAA